MRELWTQPAHSSSCIAVRRSSRTSMIPRHSLMISQQYSLNARRNIMGISIVIIGATGLNGFRVLLPLSSTDMLCAFYRPFKGLCRKELCPNFSFNNERLVCGQKPCSADSGSPVDYLVSVVVPKSTAFHAALDGTTHVLHMGSPVTMARSPCSI